MIYLLSVWPHDDPFATKVEVFNECTQVVLLYGLLLFTDFVPDPNTRYLIGWTYCGVMFGNIGVHLIILLCGTY